MSGTGLLQHYIRTGKSEKEIKLTILQFCVSLKIQSTRVCEGVTELFASEVIYVLSKIKLGQYFFTMLLVIGKLITTLAINIF